MFFAKAKLPGMDILKLTIFTCQVLVTVLISHCFVILNDKLLYEMTHSVFQMPYSVSIKITLQYMSPAFSET